MLDRDEVLSYTILGGTVDNNHISIKYNNKNLLYHNIHTIRSYWEETSYRIEEKQSIISSVREEKNNLLLQKEVKFNIPDNINEKIMYDYLADYKIYNINKIINKPKVGVLREEGSNGDREMSYCLYEAGFDVYDITVNDIKNKYINLEDLKGLVFVGGFTYSDVLGSAYGWYLTIKTNTYLLEEFDNFYNREDTFSFGVCNGCQLMALLGWIPEGISLKGMNLVGLSHVIHLLKLLKIIQLC